jgi:citronellol/citronellal dehydrogenase
MFQSALFEGEVVLVTGGGTGIGLACARRFAEAGAKLVIASRSMDHLGPARDELEAAGAEVLARTCDIREGEEVAALLEAISEHHGRLDVLVNNAGGQFPSPAISMKPKGFEAVIRNNLIGTFLITQAAAQRFFMPQRSGRIVSIIANIARGFPGMAHTGAARAGVDNLTKTLAVEWVSDGIRVNAVAPGIILSSGMANYPPALIDEALKHIPMKRAGSEDDVAHLVVFLASSAAGYITGETVYVDGGAKLWGENWPIH